jgi:hypothetical protein
MTTIASDIATWTPAVSTPKPRPRVIEYAGDGAFIYVPTDDVQESRRTVDDAGRTVGGCHVCGQDIEGEDARYYAATVRLAGRPNPAARAGDRPYAGATEVRLTERLRRHFITGHVSTSSSLREESDHE